MNIYGSGANHSLRKRGTLERTTKFHLSLVPCSIIIIIIIIIIILEKRKITDF
jgi:quinol-cytochrome oxidoreductase complex cytochrome b subunit